jgi:oligopeptide transport system substrate-binding protein
MKKEALHMLHDSRLINKAWLPSLVALILLLAACGGGGSAPTTTQPGATRAPASQQTLIWPIPGVTDIATLDPALSEDVYSGQAISMLFNGLVTYNDKTQLIPDLAQSYSLSPDGLTWTFHLRPNLKFSDGTPLTSADAAYSIDRSLQPATRSGFALTELGAIKDADKLNSGKIKTIIGDSLLTPDPQTFVIVTSKRAAYLLDSLNASPANILEKSLVSKYGLDFTKHLIGGGGGAGPWILHQYTHSRFLEFVPNPYYYGPKPQLKKVVMPIYSQQDTTYKDYQVNRVDFSFVPTAELAGAKTLPKGQFREDPALNEEFFTMNYLVKPFDNIKVRQAFALALDKDRIAQFVYKGSVIPTNHIIPQGAAGYNPDLTGPAGVKSTAGDPALAKKLLQEGLQEEGLTIATLPPITFEVSSGGQQDLRNTWAAAQQMWQSTLGIPVKINDTDFNKLVKDITGSVGNGNVMALGVGWNGSPDPYDWMTMQFAAGSGVNLSNYGQNHASDATQQQQTQQLLSQADSNVSNRAQRLQQYGQAEQQIVNDVGWITIYQVKTIYVVKPCVNGWPHNAFGQFSMTQADWGNIYISTQTPCSITNAYP